MNKFVKCQVETAQDRRCLGPGPPGAGSGDSSNTMRGRMAGSDPPAPSPSLDVVTMDKIVALCKRRGFIFPSSEIYGGVGSTYDFGHYGVLLKSNVKNEWWRAMLSERDDIVALDSAILQHPRVWEASGHLAGFTDPLVDCRALRAALPRRPPRRAAVRAQALQAPRRDAGVRPDRGARLQPDVRDDDRPREGVRRDRLPAPGDRAGDLRQLQERAAVLAQEAAVRDRAGRQVASATRSRPATSSSARASSSRWRWSSSCPPREAQKWFEHWLAERERWYTELGIRPDHLRLRAHEHDELSHYSSETSDVEYLFPIGWSELEGIANRGDFDLTQHAKFSGEKLEYFDQAIGRALRAARDRARRGRRPRDARVPRGRLRRGMRRASRAGESERARCCACTRASRRSRSRCCRS